MAGETTNTTDSETNAAPDPKTAARGMWALGDYHRFATRTVWEVGPVLVEACGISPGQRVLDVAAGTGNVAIRAAEAGAMVVASDLTPENFEAGRREAHIRGVELEWVEADAENLPFEDAEFDVVTSCFGAIFAPDHGAVAREMLRVCRPGGVIGMANFRPEGVGAALFDLVGRYAPEPPPGSDPPLLWGEEDHVRALFADGASALELQPKSYLERAAGGPEEYQNLFTSTFGPVIGLRAALEQEPERLAAFDREFREFTRRWNLGRPEGPAEYSYEYVLVLARRE